MWARSVRIRWVCPGHARSEFWVQSLAEADGYLVHQGLGYVAGGVAAEQGEHARAAQVGCQAGLAGNDVKVNVGEAFRLGEQRDVGLLAAGNLPER